MAFWPTISADPELGPVSVPVTWPGSWMLCKVPDCPLDRDDAGVETLCDGEDAGLDAVGDGELFNTGAPQSPVRQWRP
jgi:hypothetical protein